MSEVSEKKRLAALLFCLFLGPLGAHRFYVGKVWTGVLTILTFGGFFGIWPCVDSILIMAGSFTDQAGRVVKTW